MKSLVILKAGSKLPELNSVSGDFEDWIIQGLSPSAISLNVVNPEEGESLPGTGEIAAIIITGSSAMITEQKAWMNCAAKWLKEAVDNGIAVLGICFGHQLLAYALGGRVDYNPNGVEVGTVNLNLLDCAASDALFTQMGSPLQVQASHRQSVIDLPAGAVRLAYTDLDQNHAFRYGEKAWGIQFHPEFSRDVVSAYIDYYAKNLDDADRDFAMLRKTAVETPVGPKIFRNFYRVMSSG